MLETGFLAGFLGPASVAPPIVVVIALRWVLFRVEFGAGLIKLRDDPCWSGRAGPIRRRNRRPPFGFVLLCYEKPDKGTQQRVALP